MNTIDAINAWEDLVRQQGWNDHSRLHHLEGFVAHRGLGDDVDRRAKDVAAMESGLDDDAVTLPSTWQEAINSQGWLVHTQVQLLEQFLEDHNLFADFVAHARLKADVENEACESLFPSGESPTPALM